VSIVRRTPSIGRATRPMCCRTVPLERQTASLSHDAASFDKPRTPDARAAT
jgi:hypothetical protein